MFQAPSAAQSRVTAHPGAARRRRIVTVGTVLALFMATGWFGAPLALAAGNDTPATAIPITSLPFSAFDTGGWTPSPPSTGVANAAVAARCNGGQPIYIPRWFRLTLAAPTTVAVRSKTDRPVDRTSGPIISQGVAVLDARTMGIIDCSVADGESPAGPVRVPATTGVFIVQFVAEPLECSELCLYEWDRGLLVTATSGRPANDNFSQASPITSLPFTQTADTTFATSEAQDFYSSPEDCESSTWNTSVTRTAWWSFSPATSGPLTITLNGQPIDAQSSAGNSVALATLTTTGPHALDPCATPFPPVFLAGTTYLLEVATPIDTYNYDYLDSGGRVTLSVSGAVALRRPDLVVTNVSFTPLNPTAGTPIRFSATVKNQGSAASPGGIVHGVSFKVDGVAAGFSDTWNGSLAPGASVTLSATGGAAAGVWAATRGRHTVLATVDDVNRIPGEASETNNTRSATFSVAAATGKPDLVVTAVSPTPARPSAGAPVRFTATIKNQGGAPTANGVIHGVRFAVDGVIRTFSDTHTTSLAPGASVRLTANGGGSGGSWPATTGPHTVQAQVDDANRIHEANEANNTRDAAFTVGPTTSRPDLVVTAVTWSLRSPAAGVPTRFSATIKNQGTFSTPAGVIHGVSFRVNSTPVSYSDTSTASLPPGASITVTADRGGTGGAWTPTRGIRSVRAVVDDPNRIPDEANEFNNGLDTFVTIR